MRICIVKITDMRLENNGYPQQVKPPA